jgi:hypothetical protein
MGSSLFYRLTLLFAFCSMVTVANAQTGNQTVEKMHARYHNKWYKTLSFTQETGIYRNDSLIRKNTWYEMARFPFELRIDVDSLNGGNRIYYKQDSTYRIRKGKIQVAMVDPNPFVFFLGGMYMLPLDSVKSHLKTNGYDLSMGTTTTWQGRKTFVVGESNAGDSSKNQFWVDAENLYIVRVKLKMGKDFFDVQLSDHVKLARGWSETSVKFYRNGLLLQTEKYSNLNPDVVLTDDIFDISRFR